MCISRLRMHFSYASWTWIDILVKPYPHILPWYQGSGVDRLETWLDYPNAVTTGIRLACTKFPRLTWRCCSAIFTADVYEIFFFEEFDAHGGKNLMTFYMSWLYKLRSYVRLQGCARRRMTGGPGFQAPGGCVSSICH